MPPKQKKNGSKRRNSTQAKVRPVAEWNTHPMQTTLDADEMPSNVASTANTSGPLFGVPLAVAAQKSDCTRGEEHLL